MEKRIVLPIEDLNNELSLLVDREVDNFKLQKCLNSDFAQKGLNTKMVKCLFSGTKLITDMNDIEKMTFANTCFKFFKQRKYDIKQYYSHTQQLEWNNFMNVEEKINEIVCREFRKINNFEYHGDFTYEEVYKYMKNLLWLYYPATQRSSKYKTVGEDNHIRQINVNKKAVNEISKLILDDKFESTEIILNCMMFKGKHPKYEWTPVYKEHIGDLVIKPIYDIDDERYTICTILDGYHRILGICKAFEEYYEKNNEPLKGSIACKLVFADIVRAKRIVELVFKRTDDDRQWIKSLENSDYTEFVDMVVSNSRVLKNNVSDIYETCKFKNKLTYKVILTDTVKKLKIDVANKSNSLFTSADMAEIIDGIFEFSEAQDSTSDFDKYKKLPNMFIGYFTIAYILKDKDKNLSTYKEIVEKLRHYIKEEDIKNLKLDIKNCSVNKIIEYFTNIVKGV